MNRKKLHKRFVRSLRFINSPIVINECNPPTISTIIKDFKHYTLVHSSQLVSNSSAVVIQMNDRKVSPTLFK